MSDKNMPNIFAFLLSKGFINESEILKTLDGFYILNRSVSNILSVKDIFDFPDSSGERVLCNRFFDDWFLYAVPNINDCVYGLLKLREQEYDAENGLTADGDTPGVTISFISFNTERLIDCLLEPTDENRRNLSTEINRVVAYKGQNHHKALKRYFKNPKSEGAYLVSDIYVKTIASFAENGYLTVPKFYKEIFRKNSANKKISKFARLPQFINSVNEEAGSLICDNEKIFIKDKNNPSEYECLAILATHTGNTSVYSFAAEVEYHARFATPLAKIKIPFMKKSIYDSAIRADMTVGDTEFEGPAPFYKSDSKIVKRQYLLHSVSRL